MDWFSRYVLSWEVSISLETTFCITALERALSQATPQIFNSDQGCQFTSQAFTSVLEAAGIAISMDGRGRGYDNILMELKDTLECRDFCLDNGEPLRKQIL